MFFLTYIFNRLLGQIWEFFEHWFFESFKIYCHFVISLFEKFDRRLAFKITLRNIFKPLYQDKSFIGYTLGFIFRSLRLVIAGFFYSAILLIACLLYVFWLLAPLYIVFKIAEPLLRLPLK